jgi:hypothetical protein
MEKTKITLHEFFSKYKLTKKDTAVNCSLLPCDYCPIQKYRNSNKDHCLAVYKRLKRKYDNMKIWKRM